MPNVNRIFLQKTDYEMLTFLWLWRCLTTNAFHEKFYKGKSKRSAYRRLNLLQKYSYIESQSLGLPRWRGWVLTKKGYNAITEDIPELERKGYVCLSPKHDFIVSAVHLGNFLVHKPSNCSLFNEQQLLRLHPDIYPKWVPVSTDYRPDGYWHFKNKTSPCTISLEIEITNKTFRRYDRVSSFYNLNPKVNLVLWVVGTSGFAKKLKSRLDNKSVRERSPHQFFLSEDIYSHNWDSKVVEGTLKGKSLHEILVESGCNWGDIRPEISIHKKLLDPYVS